MLEGILSKLLPTENSVSKILKFDERISELQNEINVMSNIYTQRSNLLTKSSDSVYAGKILTEHEIFMGEYLKRMGGLRKELGSLTQKRDTLLALPTISKAYKACKQDRFLQSYIDKCRKGDIDQNTLSILMKGVGNGLVRYSDVICYNPEGKFLIIQRANKEDDKNSLLWGIPGGHVDMGEEHKQAAAREFWEETGIKVKEEDLSLVARYTDNEKVDIEYFQVFIDNVEPTVLLDDNETHDYKWISFKEVGNYEMPFNMQENLVKLMGGINFVQDIK